MNYKNFLKQQAILSEYKKKLLKVCPTLTSKSGIYILTRTDEAGIDYAYIGQAKNILQRLAQHMKGYPQHIDASLKKRGLYSKNNPYGWGIDFYECAESELDKCESAEIQRHKNMQLYNITSGGQGVGKSNLIDKSPKGYYQGVEYGKKKTLQEIGNYFEKYLDVVIKGKANKTKERKLNEFKELLENETKEH